MDHPVTKLTVRSDGSVISRSDGIRIIGSLPHTDFHEILSEVKKVEPRHSIYELEVQPAGTFRVLTLAPPKEGHCPNGQSLKLEKTNDSWKTTTLGPWVT